jgi:hypothetical protein
LDFFALDWLKGISSVQDLAAIVLAKAVEFADDAEAGKAIPQGDLEYIQ